MIDEYIVDYEDYVGIGSGAFSFLDGALYVNTFSLQDYGERIAEGKTPALQSRVVHHARPDALPVPDGALRDAPRQAPVQG